MPGKPVERQPTHASTRAPGKADDPANDGPRHQQERAGPVSVARHVKDDGRALILYAHAERQSPGRESP